MSHHDDRDRAADPANDRAVVQPYILGPPISTTSNVEPATTTTSSSTIIPVSSSLPLQEPVPEQTEEELQDVDLGTKKEDADFADESTVRGSDSNNGSSSQSTKVKDFDSTTVSRQETPRSKPLELNEKQAARPVSVRLPSGERDMDGDNEKKAIDDNGNVVELDGDKVFLGTEALTGKAIIKDKMVLSGGPYTEPRYHHSLPLPFMKPKHPPPPPPDSLDDAKPLPDAKANIFSLITFSWITNIMALGASRQLAPEDLYRLPPDREADALSRKLQANFQKRWNDADEYNIKLEKGEVKPPLKKRIKWAFGKGEEKGKTRAEKEEDWKNRTGKQKPNLAWALTDVFGWYFWSAGAIKVGRLGWRDDVNVVVKGTRANSILLAFLPRNLGRR
jgi:hypothetical protein